MPRRCSFKLELDFPQPLAGVDEAGCAPLAGPVVAGACILDREKFPRGIDDSKNIPIEKREALYGRLTKQAVAWGVGIQPGARVGEIKNIDVAPTVAKLLGLEMNDVDGKPLDGVLAK